MEKPVYFDGSSVPEFEESTSVKKVSVLTNEARICISANPYMINIKGIEQKQHIVKM